MGLPDVAFWPVADVAGQAALGPILT